MSLGFAVPPSFSLQRSSETDYEGLPSNGIIDMELHDNSNTLWVSTGAGLGKITDITPNLIFEGVDNSNLPIGGNPALFINDDIIVVSGVTETEYNGKYTTNCN